MNNLLENINGISDKTLELVLKNTPEWLKEHKSNAWSIFLAQSNDPLRKEKFKDVIESLEIENRPFTSGFSEKKDLDSNYWGDLSGSFSLNGKTNLNEDLAKKGVILKSLKSALVENEALVKPYLLKSNLTAKDSRFTALAEAMWTDGVLLYVPKDTDVSVPIQLLKNVGLGNTQSYYKTLVIVEERSTLTVIDEFVSNKTEDFFLVSGINEIHVKK